MSLIRLTVIGLFFTFPFCTVSCLHTCQTGWHKHFHYKTLSGERQCDYLSVSLWALVCLQWGPPPAASLSVDSHRPSAAWRPCEKHTPTGQGEPLRHRRQQVMCDRETDQLKEECRLAHRLGCWVSEVSDRAALPLLWCGNTVGEKTLFILTARWGQTPCSLSNT